MPPITPPATGPAMLFRGRGLGLGVAVLVTVVCEPKEVVVVVEVVELLLVKVTVQSFQYVYSDNFRLTFIVPDCNRGRAAVLVR